MSETEKQEKPELKLVGQPQPDAEQTGQSEPIPIAKPAGFSLDKFKSKQDPAIVGVATLLNGLPHHTISQAKDFVRLHPDDKNYWSPELCFVNVPIKGVKQNTPHLIDEDIAIQYLAPQRVLRFRLALATKPHDVFFLCHVPSRNTDNSWNETNLQACEQAKVLWTQATSRKEEGYESYKIDFSRDADAFPPPKWPKQSLAELIGATFVGRQIEDDKHPGLARLIGAKQDIS
jgi:hypothetical protein